MSQVELIFAKNLDLYRMQHPDCILVDVRSREEYEKYHIKNAVNIATGKNYDIKIILKKEEISKPIPDEANLNPLYTFDSFVAVSKSRASKADLNFL